MYAEAAAPAADPTAAASPRRLATGIRAASSASGFSPDPATLAANRIVAFERMNEHAHPFFVLRSQLLRHARTTGQQLFAVSSVQPGDGKTHVSLNLAAALSRLHPTVLIELDLHWPTVARRLGLGPVRLGLDDCLADGADPAEATVPIAGFDLTILPVRTPRFNAEGLLASPRLGELLAELRAGEGAPICIVDTPPALMTDDLAHIARAVDGVLMVVQEGRTRARALRDAIALLSPTPVIGSILNLSIARLPTTSDYSYYHRADDPRGSGEGPTALDCAPS